MTTEQDLCRYLILRRYLIRFKVIFGLGLIGIFLIMKVVFDYQHISMGVGYIALIIGIGNIIWAIYDYITLRKMKNSVFSDPTGNTENTENIKNIEEE